MPSTPVVGDILQMRVFSQASTQLGINVLHLSIKAQVAPFTSDQTLVDHLSEGFSSSWRQVQGPNSIYYGMALSLRVGVEWLQIATSIAGQGAGLLAGDVMSRQTSGVLTITAGLPGRRYRGRVFLPFPSEGGNSPDGHPNAAYVGAMSALGGAFASNMVLMEDPPGLGQTTIRMGIYHRNDGTISDVTGFNPRNKWATQKRRGDYGKPNTPPF